MASIRKRNQKWQVQVRRQGGQPISRTFSSRSDAAGWAREVERTIELGGVPVPRRQANITLGDLLHRYQAEVSTRKKSYVTDRFRIGLILRHSIAKIPVTALTPEQLAKFRDQRLAARSTETVRQDLVLLRQVLKVAMNEWGVHLPVNPVDAVTKPRASPGRIRRISTEEMAALERAMSTSRSQLLAQIVKFALSTGMRRGEILRMEWSDIDWEPGLLRIPTSKNGRSRVIPIMEAGFDILRAVHKQKPDQKIVFPTTKNAVRLGWQRLVSRAGLSNLRFHDLRHEAISRFFEAGLSIPEVALISGHRDVRQLLNYTHLQAQTIRKKLIGKTI